MRMADCHPERKHYGHGLCHACYEREYHKRRPEIWLESQKRWAAKYPEKARARSQRSSLRRNYNMTVSEYEQLLATQKGVCAICAAPESYKGRKLEVDHDHGSGHVRALLCGECNRGLAAFRDDPLLLERAIEYLGASDPPTKEVKRVLMFWFNTVVGVLVLILWAVGLWDGITYEPEERR